MKLEQYEEKWSDLKTYYSQGQMNEYKFDKLEDALLNAFAKKQQIIEAKRIIQNITENINRLESQENEFLEKYDKLLLQDQNNDSLEDKEGAKRNVTK